MGHHHTHSSNPLRRIEYKLDYLIRSVNIMAANEAEFDSALAEFMTTLDDALNTIQTKLDEESVSVDFSDELASLDQAKTRLSDFIARNAPTPEPPVDTGGGIVDGGEEPV